MSCSNMLYQIKKQLKGGSMKRISFRQYVGHDKHHYDELPDCRCDALKKEVMEAQRESALHLKEWNETKKLLTELFRLADLEEESMNQKVFKPNRILIDSCRVVDGEKMSKVLKQLKEMV